MNLEEALIITIRHGELVRRAAWPENTWLGFNPDNRRFGWSLMRPGQKGTDYDWAATEEDRRATDFVTLAMVDEQTTTQRAQA